MIRIFNHLSNSTICYRSLIVILLIGLSQVSIAQIELKCKVYYDDDGKAPPTVKILKDNFPFRQLEVSKKGKFKTLLPIGHDYMVEISKPYNFTTKLAVSTKFPDHIDTEHLFESFLVETDLIPKYEGLNGSLLNYPVMVLRFKEEEQAFVNDTVYLEIIRDRFETFLEKVDKIESKGIAKTTIDFSPKEMERIDLVEFLDKSESLMKEELNENISSDEGKEVVLESVIREEASQEPIENKEKVDKKNPPTKPSNKAEETIEVKAEKVIEVEKSSANENNANAEVDEEPNKENNLLDSTLEAKNDSIEVNPHSESVVRDTLESKEIANKEKNMDNASPIYTQYWFYLVLLGIGATIWFILARKKNSNQEEGIT